MDLDIACHINVLVDGPDSPLTPQALLRVAEAG